jgi:hypothetical protein
MLLGALIVLKYLAIGLAGLLSLAVLLIVYAAIVLSGRISREEEQTAEYRELVRRLYLAQARKDAEAEANDHGAQLDLVRP